MKAPVAEVAEARQARAEDGLEGFARLVSKREVILEIVLDLLWEKGIEDSGRTNRTSFDKRRKEV
jgi:hypothetical protein